MGCSNAKTLGGLDIYPSLRLTSLQLLPPNTVMAPSSASRFCHQFTTSILLIHRRRASPIKSFFSRPYLLLRSFSSPSSSPLPLRPLLLYSTSPVSADEAVSAAAVSPPNSPHPWPEWEQFVDKMKSKGYFAIAEVDGADASDEASTPPPSPHYSRSSMDLNRIKNACLKFARERFDIFRSLPKEDIQAVVEIGCPNIYRKYVNSAKRLRAFLKLDEGDVCSSCKLRGSCDRAYVIEKDDDKARTVDIMRILMIYAVDPALCSRENNPSMTEHVQGSARKLLVELIRLSDTIIDPALTIPAVNSSSRKEHSEKSQEVIWNSKQSRNVEMKRGDWLCANCNFLNFARNVRCLECRADGPKRVDVNSSIMKQGDWTCPSCEFMNFARNRKCFRCQEARPKRELNPGEWECPRCDFVNFRRNQACKKCNRERPESDVASAYEDHVWKSPRAAGRENKILNFGDDEDDNEGLDDDEVFEVRKRATPSKQSLNSARNWNDSM